MIRTCLMAALLLFVPVLPAGAVVDDARIQAIIRAATGAFIQPAYSEFEARGEAMAQDMARFCTAPDQTGLDQTRTDFAALVAAWSAVEIVRFGPVTEEERLERILFWPDDDGAALREVEALVAAQDQSATDPKELATKPPALQGLGALEFVLYGPASETLLEPAGAFRCSYGVAIAQNLTAIASAVRAAWEAPEGIAQLWPGFGEDNPLYKSGADALAQFLGIFSDGLVQLRDTRINAFLGPAPAQDRPRNALFRRSNQTMPSIAANLDGMQRLLNESKLAETLPLDQHWITDSIRFEFRNAKGAVGSILVPVDRALAMPDQRAKLDYLRIVTASLTEIFSLRLSPALGLPPMPAAGP